MPLTVNGIHLNYEQRGSGSNILLLPGLGATCHVWYPQLAGLSGLFRLTAIDTRGHGASGRPPGPYSIDDLAADAAGVISALALAPAVVVASSMSCLTAVRLAAVAPTLVRGLVLIGGFPVLSPSVREGMEARIALAESEGMIALADRVAAGALAPITHQQQPALVGLFRAGILANDPAAYVASIRAMLTADVTDDLPHVGCPTLVMLGEHEVVAPLPAAIELMRGLPSARLAVIPESGHLPFMERPHRVNALLLEFLAGLELERR